MKPASEELLPTRASLLVRLRNSQDQESWNEFYELYEGLVHGVARKAGLTEAEAQDVIQETMSSVAKHIAAFRYDPARGSFKAWLLKMAHWRITDQLRKRLPVAQRPAQDGTVARTGTVERVADPNLPDLEELWEAEWQANLLKPALAAVKRVLDPQKYQIFDFYVNKEWPAQKVAAAFGVSVDQVYLAKHRITQLIKEEVERLEKRLG